MITSALLSMTQETLQSLVGLIQEANAKYNALEEEHKDLQIRYNRVNQELTHLKSGILCKRCREREGEICQLCSIKFDKLLDLLQILDSLWKKQ